jgi:LysM repeat protein
VVTSTPYKNGLVYHEVQHGQTLWAIAIEYGVKIDEIRALNNLGATTEIYPEDKLLIRKDISPSSVPATSTTASTKVPSVQFSTVTGLPTLTLLPTETLTPVAKNANENSTAGIAVGVVLATLLFAGMLTWIGSRRSA